ncbi:MAG: AsmA-like C-terminal domain-containing protein, partial [Candidatus Methylomirabilales bacterium]
AVVERSEGEGRDLTVDLTGRIQRGRLEDLLGLVTPRPLPLRGVLTAEVRLTGPVTDLRGEGQVRLTRPFLIRERWEGAELTFALEPRRLRVSHLRAWRGNEEVMGEGALSFDGGYAFALTATPVALERFSAFVGVPVEGTGALTARGEGHLERPGVRAEVLLQGLAIGGLPLGTATADLRLTEGTWHLEAGFASPQVRLVATVDPDPGRPYRVQARFTDTDLTPLLRRLAPDALGATTAAAIGTLTLEGLAEEGAPRRGSLDLSAFRVTVQGETWAASPPIRLRYADGALEFAEFHLRRNGGFFTATGRLTPGRRWDVQLDGEVPLVILAPVFPAVDRLTGSGEVALQVTGPWGAPAVEGQMEIRDARLSLVGYAEPFQEIAGEVRFADGVILSRLRGRLGEGRLTADAEVRRLNGRWATEFTFALAAGEAERVLRAQGTDRGRVSGKLNADGALRAEGDDAPALWRSLKGRLNLQMLDGQVRRFRTLAKILGFLNLAELFDAPPGPDRAERAWPYTQIAGTFSVERGVARTQDLRLDSNTLKVAAVGGIDLADETLDLTLVVQPLQRLDAVLGRIPVAGYILTGKEGRFVTIYLTVTGPVDDPHIRGETLTTLGRGLTGFFERLLGVPGQLLPAPQ